MNKIERKEHNKTRLDIKKFYRYKLNTDSGQLSPQIKRLSIFLGDKQSGCS